MVPIFLTNSKTILSVQPVVIRLNIVVPNVKTNGIVLENASFLAGRNIKRCAKLLLKLSRKMLSSKMSKRKKEKNKLIPSKLKKRSHLLRMWPLLTRLQRKLLIPKLLNYKLRAKMRISSKLRKRIRNREKQRSYVFKSRKCQSKK